jgi:hypothetical protein
MLQKAIHYLRRRNVSNHSSRARASGRGWDGESAWIRSPGRAMARGCSNVIRVPGAMSHMATHRRGPNLLPSSCITVKNMGSASAAMIHKTKTTTRELCVRKCCTRTHISLCLKRRTGAFVSSVKIRRKEGKNAH